MARKRFPDQAPVTKINYVEGRPASVVLRKCVLVSLGDPQLPAYGFDKDQINIGAMDDNDIVLRDETVSRYHCRVSQEDDSYVLRDEGSTNGTFVDGVRIREAFLSPGCTIGVGRAELRFECREEQHEVKPSERKRVGGLIGQSRRMREIFGIVEKIAPTSATVVIEGETGTGKEVVAKALHALSSRAPNPFIVFDCGAVPDNLIESELFGHEKGSFTGAVMSRRGLFEMAQGGTIFLDELCELDLELQPKLLRVLEQREVRRVGSNRPVRVDVRVIAATNRDLEEEVRAKRFREDLFFRLSVVRVLLPPLRERADDVPILAKHFLANEGFNRRLDGTRRVRDLTPEAAEALVGYEWPGNVRELLNVLERACSFAETDRIQVEDLPPHLRQAGGLRSTQPPSSGRPARALPPEADEPALTGAPAAPQRSTSSPVPSGAVAVPASMIEGDSDSGEPRTFKDAKEEWIGAFEREYIAELLRRNGMNISHAAREADIDRKYFRKLMRKYGIDAADAGED